MDGWMGGCVCVLDGCMNEGTDGGMESWVEEWMDGWDELIGWKEGRGWTDDEDGRTDRYAEGGVERPQRNLVLT